MKPRVCSKTGCSAGAAATLTYVYADSTAVLGPLAHRHEPGSYDLCKHHAAGLSAPRGWEIIRLPASDEPAPTHTDDDLLALADAVREVGFATPPTARESVHHGVVEITRRGHLTVLADPDV